MSLLFTYNLIPTFASMRMSLRITASTPNSTGDVKSPMPLHLHQSLFNSKAQPSQLSTLTTIPYGAALNTTGKRILQYSQTNPPRHHHHQNPHPVPNKSN